MSSSTALITAVAQPPGAINGTEFARKVRASMVTLSAVDVSGDGWVIVRRKRQVQYSFTTHVTSGGTRATREVRERDVRGVLASTEQRELVSGTSRTRTRVRGSWGPWANDDPATTIGEMVGFGSGDLGSVAADIADTPQFTKDQRCGDCWTGSSEDGRRVIRINFDATRLVAIEAAISKGQLTTGVTTKFSGFALR